MENFVKENEKEVWDKASSMLQNFKYALGKNSSPDFRKDPKKLIHSLSRYKFSSKMIKKGSSILELGCGEAIGANILAEQASKYVGIDPDRAAIDSARKNLREEKFSLACDEFFGKKYGAFDAIVSFDQIEKIPQKNHTLFFHTILQNLAEDGVCLLGTENAQLKETLKGYFQQVFAFAMNEEIVHTAVENGSYFIFLSFFKKD